MPTESGQASVPGDRATPGGAHVPIHDVQRLADAIARLDNDPVWFLQAATEFTLSIRPVSPSGLTKEQEEFLIESGTFSVEELAATREAIARGALQLDVFESWLVRLCETLSLDSVLGFLGWDDATVLQAVADHRLYAVEISGRLRFPAWQLSLGSPGKLLPGLTEVIAAISPRWGHASASGFMHTPQEDLVIEGRQTPLEFLRRGGDVAEVVSIVEASDWR